MDCRRNTLGVSWFHHGWDRRVTQSETLTFNKTDQWGRVVSADHVLCRTEYVCRECGVVRDERSCGCDPERAERCAVRLEWLGQSAAPPATRI